MARQFEIRARDMVESQIRRRGITDEHVLTAMLQVPTTHAANRLRMIRHLTIVWTRLRPDGARVGDTTSYAFPPTVILYVE